ncbi:MAG TPA: hypothetical protein VM324_16065 [Egibacteraceae bacterium]|nr:hypothetical protein [Egibacteraceae bacterium]
MPSERYVLLGLGRPRADWFRAVGQWATTAAVPAEFGKCVSAEELRTRLRTGQACSAVLLDGSLAAVERDLIADVRDAGAAPIVVDAGTRDWAALGALAVLPPGFGRAELLDVLASHAELVAFGEVEGTGLDGSMEVPAAMPGRILAVCGPGGTGASTVAIALAQGIAAQADTSVVLADCCRRAEQVMLHDARDVFPGIQELVDAHRNGVPGLADVRASTFHVAERGYHLLLGLRQSRYWATLRPRALDAALDSLVRGFNAVVCDIDSDLEGEDQAGSSDVEERNLLSRRPAQRAELVLVVGSASMKGLHSLVHVVADLVAAGVQPNRIGLVVNQAPRKVKQRAELARSLARLLPRAGVPEPPGPLFLPEARVEQALRDGVALPAPLPALLAGACEAALRRLAEPGRLSTPSTQPIRVRPGSLGVVGKAEG